MYVPDNLFHIWEIIIKETRDRYQCYVFLNEKVYKVFGMHIIPETHSRSSQSKICHHQISTDEQNL